MTSALFSVAGSVAQTEHVVAHGSTTTVAIVNTAGIDTVEWSVVGQSHATTAVTIAPVGKGYTATVTFPSDPGYDQAVLLEAKCNGGRGPTGAHGANLICRRVIGTKTHGVTVPVCANEEFERDAIVGWAKAVNGAQGSPDILTPVNVAVARPATGTVLTTFQSGHGWIAAYAGYGSIDLNSTVDPFVGTQCARVTSAGTGAVTGLKKWAMTAMDFTGKCLRVAIKVTNLAHLDATEGIWVYLGSSSLANYRVFVVKPQTQHWLVEGEWCELTIPWNESSSRSSTGGTLSRSSVTDLTVRFKDDNTGSQVSVALGRVSIVAETTPSISFTFDDGYDSIYTTAFPILFAKGWAATHYTICELIDQAGRLTTAQLKALQRSGWDIALHSFSSAVHTATYPSTTDSALVYDLEKGKEWLKSRGFKGFTHGSFPLGSFVGSTDALAIVRQRFAAFRSIYSLVGESYPPDDPHRLRITVNLSYPLSLASAQALIDAAIAAKEHVTILAHSIVTTPTVEGQWSTADFQSLCNYISTTYPSVAVSPIGNALSIV